MARMIDLSRMGCQARVDRPEPSLEDAAESENGVEGSAELVAHPSEERGLGPASLERQIPCLCELCRRFLQAPNHELEVVDERHDLARRWTTGLLRDLEFFAGSCDAPYADLGITLNDMQRSTTSTIDIVPVHTTGVR